MDDDSLELLERRLTERVEKQVRNRLIAIYSIIGGGWLAAVSWLGYNALEDFKTRYQAKADNFAIEVDEFVRKAAESAVAGAVSEAEEAARQARDVAKNAEKEVANSKAMLETFDYWKTEGSKKLNRTVEEMSSAREESQRSIEKIYDQISEVHSSVSVLQERADAMYLPQEASQIISQLSDDIRLIKIDLENIDRYIRELEPGQSGGTPDDSITSTGGSEQADADNKSIQVALENLTAGPAKTTVFFQFAGSTTRAQAQEIAKRLEQEGYRVPGEERTQDARTLHQVRYFYEDEEREAELLSKNVNQILYDLGFRGNVKAVPFIDFKGRKPKKGVLELWLEPVRR